MDRSINLVDLASPRQHDWARAGRILAIRLDNLGDVLMTTPAISMLRQRAAWHVCLLASPAGAQVAGHLPDIDDVLAFDAPWVKGPTSAPGAEQRLVERLAHGRFDAAVIFTVSTQSALPAALVCRMAGIPLRLAHSRENPYELLTDWVPDHDVCADGMSHEVERQIELVRSVGFVPGDDRLRFSCSPGDVQAMRARLTQAGGDPDRPFMLVHTGSSAPSRRYPAERFGRAAASVARESGLQVVFCSGVHEVDQIAAAQAAMGTTSVSLAGALSIGELGALTGQARIVLCNNSAPSHLAAAAGTPVVVLYALTNPQHTPWKVPARVLSHDVPCRNCLRSECPLGHNDCLRRIEAEKVAEAVLDLLTATEARPSRVAAR